MRRFIGLNYNLHVLKSGRYRIPVFIKENIAFQLALETSSRLSASHP